MQTNTEMPGAVTVTTRALRALLIAVGILAWFGTQELISKRGFPDGVIGDYLHFVTAPWNAYLAQHAAITDALLVVSSGFIDLFVIFLLLRSITGLTIRPFLGLVLLFGLRQILQTLCALPPPDHMIWHYPGVPSLLVTYGVANDFFFSGHTSVAVYGAFELSRLGKRWLTFSAIVVAVFEVLTVLTLRAHYTMDIFAGAVTALLVGILVDKLAPSVDRALVGLRNRSFMCLISLRAHGGNNGLRSRPRFRRTFQSRRHRLNIRGTTDPRG